MYYNTVKPRLRDHCHETPPVLTDHIFVANGVVFQERFYCILSPTIKLVLNDVVEHLEQEEYKMVIGRTGVEEPRGAERLSDKNTYYS